MAIRILGTGSCLAEKEVSNDELAKYVVIHLMSGYLQEQV